MSNFKRNSLGDEKKNLDDFFLFRWSAESHITIEILKRLIAIRKVHKYKEIERPKSSDVIRENSIRIHKKRCL